MGIRTDVLIMLIELYILNEVILFMLFYAESTILIKQKKQADVI